MTTDPHSERLLPANSIGEAFELNGVLRRYRRDSQIYGEAEDAEFFYQLASGAVRTCKTFRDGRRQVGAFYLAGDVFGLEAGLTHALNAECLVPSTLRIIRRGTVLSMASRDPCLATDLWMRTAEDLQRAHEHMLLLSRTTAEERVVGFLLDMAARTPGEPEVDLPMTRRDIADYLGLAIETVSRDSYESRSLCCHTPFQSQALRSPKQGRFRALSDRRPLSRRQRTPRPKSDE